MKYQLLIIWRDVEPELNPNVQDSYDELVTLARRVREMEGDEHGLYYLEWEEGQRDVLSVGSFGGAELEEDEDEI